MYSDVRHDLVAATQGIWICGANPALEGILGSTEYVFVRTCVAMGWRVKWLVLPRWFEPSLSSTSLTYLRCRPSRKLVRF